MTQALSSLLKKTLKVKGHVSVCYSLSAEDYEVVAVADVNVTMDFIKWYSNLTTLPEIM